MTNYKQLIGDLRKAKKRNWKLKDLEATLKQLGFKKGKVKHKTFWRHQDYNDIKIGLPKKKTLAPIYIGETVKKAEKVLERKKLEKAMPQKNSKK